MALRVTRQYDEVLAAGAGKLRVTRQYAEVLTSPPILENISSDLNLTGNASYDVIKLSMSIDKNIARWIFSSIAVYFDAIASPLNIPLLVEGVDERETDIMESDHAELRINGPFIKELSRDYWRIYVDINILLTDHMAMTQEDAYEIIQRCGAFQQAMFVPIPVKKYGTGVDDDGTQIGCLTLRKTKNDNVKIIHFGQISRVDRIRQSVIDGRYKMYLVM